MRKLFKLFVFISLIFFIGCTKISKDTEPLVSYGKDSVDLKNFEKQYIEAINNTIESFNASNVSSFEVLYIETLLGTTSIEEDGTITYYETTKSNDNAQGTQAIRSVEIYLTYLGEQKGGDLLTFENMLLEQEIFTTQKPLLIMSVDQDLKETYDSILQEYFILDDFLWHKDKKLIDQRIFELFWPEEGPAMENATELTKFFKDNKIFLFFIKNGGCGGCNSVSPHYFVINPKDDSVETKKLDEYSPHGLRLQIFSSGQISLATLSSDKKKIAYANIDANNLEYIHVYDFEKEKEYLVHTLKPGGTVMHCPYVYCSLVDNAIYWDGLSQYLNIKPIDPDPYLEEEAFEPYEIRINVGKL